MKVTTKLFVIVFVIVASPALSDIDIFIRADFSKIKTVSKNNVYSEEVIFEEGKAIWTEYGDYHFAFYNEKALKLLADCDSTKVFLAPAFRKGEVTPPFGNLYIVLKNILWGVGESYGLDAEVYYVWPVKFLSFENGPKVSNGIIYEGIAPFGDGAIEEIKLNGRKITKDFFVSLGKRSRK